MAKKTKKQELRFDAHLNIGQVASIASSICDERTDQMAVELVDKYIALNHADHIRLNEVVYNKLLDVVKSKLRVNTKMSEGIYTNIINADYDIRCGYGNGRFI